MDKLAQNSFSNGLALDNSPFVQVNSTLKNCLNGTILTFKGNEYVLQNDLGNGKVGLKDKEGNIEYVKLSEGFVPLGVKEHGGIIYIVSKNPKTGQEEIGSFPSPEYDTPLNTITLIDSKTIDYNSNYTEKIFKTTAINVGDVINFSYESDSSSKSPTINIWDLNNVKDKNEPNRMANFQIIFNSKESNDLDRTEELFNSKVIKTNSNGNVFNKDGYNTTLEDYIIKERNTKITLKVTPSKIQSLTAGTGGNVENNKLYLKQDYLLFKYDCPDGDANYPYQYQNSTGREVNYFKKIEGTIQKSGGGQQPITDFLKDPIINKKNKVYTRLYTINSDKFTNFKENDKLKITVTGIKKENGNIEEFITYESEFLNFITNNLQLLQYKPNVEINKYFRFVWNRINNTIIWGKDANPYTDNINKNYHKLNTNSIKIWYVAPFQSKIAIFNMSKPKLYGRILDNRQVGQAVQKSQEVENSQLLYRSIYEFIKDTDESDKDYYLVIAFDIKNDSLIIKDVEYFFPLLSVYKDNTIPCSITYNADDHSDNLKPDAFGGKNGYLADNYEGQNEISSKLTNPICVFGRQMTDSGRNFKLTLDDNNELHGLLLTTNNVDSSEFINYSYELKLNNDNQTNWQGQNIYIDITNLQSSSGYKNCKYIYGYLYKPSIENAGPNGAITYWNKIDETLKWTKEDYKDYLCDKIYNDDGHVGLQYDNPYSAYFKILLDKTNLINTLSFKIKADDYPLNVKDGIWFYEDNLDIFRNTTKVSVINNCISKLNVFRIKDCTLFQSDNSIKFTYTNPGSSVLIQVENKDISEYFKDYFNKVFTSTGNLYDLLVVDIIKQDNIVNYLEKSENDILVFIRRNDGNSVSIFYPNLGKDSNGNNIRLEAVIPDFEEHYLKNSENETNTTDITLYTYNQQQNYSNQYFTLENFNLLLKDIDKDEFIYRKLSEEDTPLLEKFRTKSNINNDIYYTINPSLLNENKFINVKDYSLKRQPQNVTWHYATFDGNSSNNPNFFDGYGESNLKIYQYNNGEKLFIFPKDHNCKVIYNRIGKKISVDFNDFDEQNTDYYFKTDKFVIFCNKNTNLVNSCNYKKDTLTLNCTPDYVSTNIKPCPTNYYPSKYFVL